MPFALWVLCWDAETRDILTRLGLPNLRLITRAEFESGDEGLARAKTDRSRVEYYWTCTPSLPLYIFGQNPDVEVLTYVDADLFFYRDPQPIYEEFADASILIVAHRYGPELAHLAEYGIYNVGLMVFRRDAPGLACLRWWRERCLEWCRAEPENGKFGDQKYLDDWPQRFPRVRALQHPGAGLAPWNWMNYDLRFHGQQASVAGWPLIFYHFHGLKILNGWLYDPGLSLYRTMPAPTRRWFYEPYLHALRAAWQMARRVAPGAKFGYARLGPGGYGYVMLVRRLLRGRLALTL